MDAQAQAMGAVLRNRTRARLCQIHDLVDQLDLALGDVDQASQVEELGELIGAASDLLEHARASAITPAAPRGDRELGLLRAAIAELNGQEIAPPDLRMAVSALLKP